jgi:hypothetical protein
MDEIQKLAEIMHEKMCRWNHTDGCDWYYDKWTGFADKPTEYGNSTRQRYFDAAVRILVQHDFETAEFIIKNIPKY